MSWYRKGPSFQSLTSIVKDATSPMWWFAKVRVATCVRKAIACSGKPAAQKYVTTSATLHCNKFWLIFSLRELWEDVKRRRVEMQTTIETKERAMER